MSELITHQPTAQIMTVPDAGTELILRAVEQMAGAAQLGQALAGTAFVPAAFRGKPDDAAAAIMYGAAIGLDPMTSLRAVYVIGGTPGLYARQMVAVVMSKGHEVWTVESTDESVTVSGRRRGSGVVETVTWTYERARKAGYTSNKKYDTDPQAMLWARAAGDVARRIAPDALAGLDYSVEELQVIEHVEDARLVAPGKASILQATARVVEAERASGGTVEAESTSVVGDPGGPDQITPSATPAQVGAIQGLMRDLGVTSRAQILAKLSEQVGRPLSSSKELTKGEATYAIEALTEEVAALERARHPEPADEPQAKSLPLDEPAAS